jgi:hypothetical protein
MYILEQITNMATVKGLKLYPRNGTPTELALSNKFFTKIRTTVIVAVDLCDEKSVQHYHSCPELLVW